MNYKTNKSMNLVILFFASIVFFFTAHSAPFVVSDSWPAGEAQPTHCRYQLNGNPEVDAPVEKNADGSVRCLMDIANAVSGKNTIRVRAVNKKAKPMTISEPNSMEFDSGKKEELKGIESSPSPSENSGVDWQVIGIVLLGFFLVFGIAIFFKKKKKLNC